MQLPIAVDDLGIDPGVTALGTCPNDFAEPLIDPDFERLTGGDPAQPVGNMKPVERQNGPRIRRKPLNGAVPHAHGKNAQTVSLEEKLGRDHE
jgi:hypothetical protein